MNRNFYSFVKESNKIEGILREPTVEEIAAHITFCDLEQPTVEDLVRLVSVLQPDARLRDAYHVPGVRVGNHIAPRSGPEIREQLNSILEDAYNNFELRMEHGNIVENKSWELHCDYETLHPFTDGNGRSGRALWLWMNGGLAPLGFLHSFYYQTLSNYR